MQQKTTQPQGVEGLITDEAIEAARRRIGIEMPQDRPGWEYADIDPIRNYSEGIGDLNPLYQDVEYARKTRWGDLVAHPTMMTQMGIANKKKLTPEERELGRGGGLAGVHSFYSGDDIEWFRPVLRGDRLTVRGGLAKVEPKGSRMTGTRSVHMTTDRVYHNQKGEIVGVRHTLQIRVERHNAREAGKYKDIQTQTYTTEDMARIDADYAKEEIRGANPRYWEDVVVGQELTPVVKGPWTATAYIVFCEGTGHRNEFHRAHSSAYQYRKRHPNAFPLTKYGFPDVIMRVHWEHEMARETGLPAYYDYGGERIAWLSHAVTDWMGDDGFLRWLHVELRRFCFYGDTMWIKGRVANKYVEEGEHIVELDLWAENQRGELTAPGKAKVLLPSRTAGPVKIPTRIPSDVSPYA